MLGLGGSGRWSVRRSGSRGWARVVLGAVSALAAAAPAVGCSAPSTSAEFAYAPPAVLLSLDDLMLPEELRDDGTDPPTVMQVPCGSDADCPDAEEVTVSCGTEGCDPEPIQLSVPLGDRFDLETYQSSLSFAEVDSFEILSAEAMVSSVSSDFSHDTLPAMEVYWSSVGALRGQTLLGTVEPAPAEEGTTVPVAIDDGGQSALSEYLLNQEPRARLFVETELDLDPGEQWPAGELEVNIVVRVRVEGSLI
ncbi:MAG: hypothetical protein ACODAU_01695 [Myxococcota bacterium]